MARLIQLDEIATVLGLGSRSHVALVGGGGKTTVLHALGRTLPGQVVLTTTVKMGADQHGGHEVLLDPPVSQVVSAASNGPVVVWSRVDGQKAIGIDPVKCDAIFAARTGRTGIDYVIIEADGSRRQPFKAPAQFEPVMPSTVTVVASLIGIDVIGRVIADRCHRPMRVAALAGVRPYERLTAQGAAAVLAHQRGQRRSVPAGARYVVVVNKVESATHPTFVELNERLEDVGIEAIGVEAAEIQAVGIGQTDASVLSALR